MGQFLLQFLLTVYFFKRFFVDSLIEWFHSAIDDEQITSIQLVEISDDDSFLSYIYSFVDDFISFIFNLSWEYFVAFVACSIIYLQIMIALIESYLEKPPRKPERNPISYNKKPRPQPKNSWAKRRRVKVKVRVNFYKKAT